MFSRLFCVSKQFASVANAPTRRGKHSGKNAIMRWRHANFAEKRGEELSPEEKGEEEWRGRNFIVQA